MTFTITHSDATSGIATVEYYIDNDTTAVKTQKELDSVAVWETYNETGIDFEKKDQVFVLYAKVTDKAGNITYTATNGIVSDITLPNSIEILPVTKDYSGFYKDNVELKVEVTDDATYASGIKSITYEVFNGETKTQSGELFQFKIDDPTYEQLVFSWNSESSEEEKKNIVVDASLNNSDEVTVVVTVVDNAGNSNSNEISLKICTAVPTMSLKYIDDPEAVRTEGGIAYYDKNRKAEITITARTSIFEASRSDGLSVSMGNSATEETFKVSDWTTTEVVGDPDAATHTCTVELFGNANYDVSVNYTDVFENELRYSEKFVVDHDDPTGTVKVGELGAWDKLVEMLTFGLWSKEKVTVTVEANDATSPYEVTMYRTDGTTALSETELKARYEADKTCEDPELLNFKPYEPLNVEPDERFTLYVRIEDYAGHVTYISSDGIVVEETKAGITLELPDTDREHDGKPVYKDDVVVEISVKELADNTYSGIKEVKYWVTCDGKTTQEKTLYTYEYTMDQYVYEPEEGEEASDARKNVPTYDDLTHEFNDTVTIVAKDNNSCNVVLNVYVCDNAGNEWTETRNLDIDVTTPTIEVSFDNNDVKRTEGDRGYFDAARTATVTITEKAGHFDADKALESIQIKAVDANGETIKVKETDEEGNEIIKDYIVPIRWDDEASVGDTHVAIIDFSADANYEFTLSYEDLAGNNCAYEKVTFAEGTAAERYFTVDKTQPTGTITAKELSKSWTDLISVLTFGLWSKEKVTVTVEASDATSPYEVTMYRTDGTTALSETELKARYEADKNCEDPERRNFKPYEPLNVEPDERFTLYVRIEDYAGHVTYISSNGVILDNTPVLEENIVITPVTQDYNGFYNGNVELNVQVKDDATYASGIKSIRYEVYNGETKTQSGELFKFENENPEYKDLVFSWNSNEVGQNIAVDASLNNSDDVKVVVTVVDNAGNSNSNEIYLKICTAVPTMSVKYIDDPEAVRTEGGIAYYDKNRKAEITLTARTSIFEASYPDGVPVSITATKGDSATEETFKVNDWMTTEAVGDPDAATHTCTVEFFGNANYDFSVNYTDVFENELTYSEKFVVDHDDPTGTITAKELNKSWSDLISVLTFGLWRNDKVTVTATPDDATSPIYEVKMYRTDETTALTKEALDALYEAGKTCEDPDNLNFVPYEELTVSPNERFTLYVRIEDYAGNYTYISSNGVILDNTPVTKDGISITPVTKDHNGFYNGNVELSVSVTDETKPSSGIQSIIYEVFDGEKKTQNGDLFTFENNNPSYSDLVNSVDKMKILVEADKNNSNDVVVRVTVTDNAGNKEFNEYKLAIDITKPTITVTYDNNDGDSSFPGSTYFDANRTATITITERNFDPKLVDLTITNTDGYVPTLSGWTTVAGTGNGDDTKHIATVLFDKDGDYTFGISCTDLATNPNEGSFETQKFTIDKTAPIVDITYDNNDALNENFYKEQRTATITITEHNFETSRIAVSLKATDNGTAIDLPTVSEWRSNGDVHTATITYAADAHYTFDFEYADQAGNAIDDVEEQNFYVDTTAPVLKIEKIVDESANNDKGNIGFIMTATDTNFDVFTPVLTAVIRNGDRFETKELDIGEFTDIENGRVYTVTNLDTDGIYRIICTLVDKAGNAFTEVILEDADGKAYTEQRTAEDVLVTFSVNREGSTFEADKNTTDVVNRYYVKNVENDVVIVEINADPLKEHTVTLNGKELTEGVDYTVTEEGGNGAWMKYTYTLNKDLFAEEGEYTVVVFSKDKADNDAFSDVKEAAVSFVVDRTAPIVTVSGITTGGRYQTTSQLVTLIPTDDGGALSSLIVNLVDEDGKVLQELINLSGDALAEALEANEGKITFELAEGLYQNVQIICADCATDGSEETNIFSETIKNVSVSSSAFMIFWANKPLRWGVIGGLSLLVVGIVVLVVHKKKKVKTA